MSAVIVDVDGTLAEFHPHQVSDWVLGSQKQWEPFFAHMAEAPVVEAVARLVKILKAQGQQIVICSGRPDSHREHTQRWLERHTIPFDAMYLRPEGDDHVDDEEVKAALLNQIRRDGFAPWLVLDDRDAVVAHWRALGLTCLQCAPGDF
ncbi:MULTISPECIES: HAD family acid phosphatase [unclassified Halomonas]|uniref:phosphatase domain-containing protein n=1 Tax=unclassified Halomonas TaxID=2609666 RepID=UPI0007D9E565|nr:MULTISPECIES: HAD family acid phosphatase [unclassified Halomonas]MBT2786111.1 polynucleotide kinase [Halomonas sp. ISL-106]MBT2797133.1 polynucleotide kinase [Halomonas sp. ISL-104]OAL58514.1 polynucleotide kinase [Halomonas sp. ALS9]